MTEPRGLAWLAASLVLLSARSAYADDPEPVGTPAPVAPAPPGGPAPPIVPAAPPAPAVPALHAAPADVTVAGTRVSRSAGSAHILGEERLQRFKYDDPTTVVTQVPGVYARGEDGFGLRPNIGIRGVNPDRSKKIALLEDGIPFAPAPYSASAAYFFPVITRMTAVRVIKGPAAISYGPQTIGGAIDLITRPIPTETSGAADLAYGTFGYGKAHAWAGTSNEKIGFLVEGIHLRSDGFKDLPNGADTGFTHNEWMVKGSYVLDPAARVRNEFRVKGTYSDEVSNETYVGLADQDLRVEPNRRYAATSLDRMKWFHTSLAFSHVVEPSVDTSITTTLYRNDFSRVWRKVNRFRGADIFEVLRDPTSPRNAIFTSILRGESDSSGSAEAVMVGPNQRDFVSQGLESRVRTNGRTGPIEHRVEYGARVHEDRAERRHSEDAFLVTNGQLVPEGSPTVVTTFNEASTLAFAVHAIDAMTWEGLTLTPGVRVEALQSTFVDRATGERNRQLTQVVLPGVGAFYSLTRDLGVLGGVYRGFGPPVPALGPRVEPELSVNYEAGARFTHGRARLEVIGFYNEYSNLTDVCTLSSGCVEKNLDRQFDAGRARIYGLEAYAEHRVPLGRGLHAPLNAAYTFTQTEFRSTFKSDDPIFGSVARGDEIPYVPRHQVNLAAGLEHRRGGGNASMSYVAKTREQAGSGPIDEALHTDAQLLFDVSLYARLLENVVLYANVRNLFDERYIVGRRPYGARPNPPRTMQVGLKVSF